MENMDDINYQKAYARVKRIKRFYIHLIVYIVINIMILVSKYQKLETGEDFFQFKYFTTAFFWGIALLIHTLSVFLPGMLLGKKWEDKKIEELMEKEKKQRWE